MEGGCALDEVVDIQALLEKWQHLLDLTHWDISLQPCEEITDGVRRYPASITHEYTGGIWSARRAVLSCDVELARDPLEAERQIILMLAHLICQARTAEKELPFTGGAWKGRQLGTLVADFALGVKPIPPVLPTGTWAQIEAAFRVWQKALGAEDLEIELIEGQNPERYGQPRPGTSSVVPTRDTDKQTGEIEKVGEKRYRVWIDPAYIAEKVKVVRWGSTTDVIVHEVLEAVIGLQLAGPTDRLKDAILGHFVRVLRRLSGEAVPTVTADG